MSRKNNTVPAEYKADTVEYLGRAWPEGSEITTALIATRRNGSGVTSSDLLVMRNGVNVAQDVATAVGGRVVPAPAAGQAGSALVRGQFGGTGQGSALTYELGRVVHGSSTAFKHRSI
jgi:hypothetical protein